MTPRSEPPDARNPFAGGLRPVLEQQEFVAHLLGDEAFLTAHAQDSSSALLGLAFLELGKASGEWTLGRPIAGVKNAVWGRPVRLNGGGQTVGARVLREGPDLVYQIFTDGAGGRLVHHYGELVLDDQPPAGALDLAAVESRLALSPSLSELAEFVRRRDPRRDALVECVQALRQNDREVLCRLAVPEPAAERVSRSSLLDLAWHLVAFWEERDRVRRSSPLFPFAVEQVRFGEGLSSEIFIHVTRSPSEGGSMTYDVSCCSPDGRRCVACHDLSGLELDQLAGVAL